MSTVRRGFAVAWPLLLAAWMYQVAGWRGFSPTDEGYVLAQSWRLLQGEVPHRDVISPRPLGSAVLHVVDFALPVPLIPGSRGIALLEIVAYSLLLARLLYGRPLAAWGLAEVLAAAASVLVNLHAVPLMAWYTIDGLLCLSAGLWCLERGSSRWGLWWLGVAAVTKQSFLFAPLLAIVPQVMARRGAAPSSQLRGIAADSLLAGAPLGLYAFVVGLLGGGPAMWEQLSVARPTFGSILFGWLVGAQAANLHGVVFRVALASLLATALLRGRWVRARWWGQAVALCVRGVVTGVIVWIAVSEGLTFGSRASLASFWICAVLVVERSVLDWRWDRAGFTVLAIAWMVTLSWGYPLPGLVGGVLALASLDRLWRAAAPAACSPRLAAVGLALLAGTGACLITASWLAAREQPYRDRHVAELTAPLRLVAPAFGAVHTNPTTAGFLQRLVECIRKFPAGSVAVLPDNAWVYPALGLRNPLPIDWLFADEIAGAGPRLLAAAQALGHRRDFLVLFATDTADRLAVMVEPSRPDEFSVPYSYARQTIAADLFAALGGIQSECGPFLVKWSPARTAPLER